MANLLIELHNKKLEVKNQMEEIHATAKKEERKLSEEEREKWNAFKAQYADVAQEIDQIVIGGKDAMIEAVPGEGSEVFIGRQPAELVGTFVERDCVAFFRNLEGERDSHHPAADDP